MSDTDNSTEQLLEFAENLILQKTETYCSELQRRILSTALQGERKTYDQIADECGYSPKYVKQDVAPKLWHLLSQALDKKVSKSNVRFILAQEMRSATQAASTPTPIQPSPAIVEPPLLDATGLSGKIKILLVDDQPQNLRLLTDVLEEQRYEVLQALNGEVALQAVALDQPQLVLLDIQMPEMDGYTVCQKLKANPSTQYIPVIFISALDESWDKVKAFSAGGVDYITKPFKVVEVLARVENQLKIQQLQQALRTQNAQLQQANLELQRLAALDDLTQAANRRRFDAYLLTSWQAAIQGQYSLTLMLCQLDHFNVYSTGGQSQPGDQCLYDIAQSIKQAIQGPNDLVCRYGTFTFAIVLPQQTTTQTEPLAQQLLTQIEQLAMGSPPITLSIGLAAIQPTAELGIEAFIEACDRNLQQARSDGGNRVVTHDVLSTYGGAEF
ncbi:diguanylate cyclase [Acaryochloris sp. IP29b_bin.148]|uniref:diguanylate cyclase domain-containing protein n=1 Tax=Acaryochloris sp. IP29b_bin.148 TaxID=2969218 RepID=UPI002603DF62|nr:diguanylate cyclase [Acaryochloris sp. IP29b_bin.148]